MEVWNSVRPAVLGHIGLLALVPVALAQSPPLSRQNTATTPGSVIVIDAGHGGEDVGVHGESGVVEKDLTLQLAQRLAAAIGTRPGLRVVVTREVDRAMSADERDAIANRARGDALVSIHFNSDPSPNAAGSVIYVPALDRDAQARRDGTPPLVVPVPGGAPRTLPLVAWEAAQQAHAEESARLAALVQEELQKVVPLDRRPVRTAPMRVLAGADMPAVLIEVAYLSNVEQSEQAPTESFQASVTQAVAEALSRFVAGAQPDTAEAR